MRGIRSGWPMLVLLAALAATPAQAGPYLGDWGWCWKPAKDCPKGCYSCLHYWAPTLYWVKYCLFPAHIEEAPPGAPVPVNYLAQKYPCRTTLPTPQPPYLDPAGFYGRPLLPTPGQEQAQKDLSETGLSGTDSK